MLAVAFLASYLVAIHRAPAARALVAAALSTVGSIVVLVALIELATLVDLPALLRRIPAGARLNSEAATLTALLIMSVGVVAMSLLVIRAGRPRERPAA